MSRQARESSPLLTSLTSLRNSLQFDRDDPYASELGAWLDECDHGKAADDSAVADDDESYGILSSYEDAAKSYALSWAIRFASEANTQRFRKKEKKILSLDALKERK